MSRSWYVAPFLGLLSGCAGAAQAPVVTIVNPQSDSVRERYAVRPVEPTRAFERALTAGTRTQAGSPGPRYWQQQVQYRIDAELNPATSVLQGEETVLYRNNSPDTLRSVLMHLYQNAYGPGVQRVRRVPVTGGVTLRRVAVDDRIAVAAAPGGATGLRYRVDGTLLWIDLARPLLPGGSLELEIGWEFRVPPQGAPRTGHSRNEAFVVAQWYPQVAVYDDLRGWHDKPYWTNGEFYLEYAGFEVSITVPEGWLVGGTGSLENADEVVSAETQERLRRALTQDSIVHVITEEDLEQGLATSRAPGAQLTWRFRASDIRDFAFAASNRYLWDATRALLPDANGDGTQETVLVNALYRPEATAWREAARYMRHAVTFHARHWGPYIYPHITAAEGPIGGMEYPMMVFIGAPSDPQALYSVLSHEIAHEWWPMMVGSAETLYAWQDEGLVTYVEDLSVSEYFPGSQPELATQSSYLRIAGTDAELPLMTAPDLFGIGPQYGVAAYTKPGTLLRALSGVVGADVVERGLRAYTTQWLLKHPSPYDFFHVMEAAAGRDLDWFWSPFWFETEVFDQSIDQVTTETRGSDEHVTITIRDLGGAPLPVRLTITLSDGTTRETVLPVEPWVAGALTQTAVLDVPAAVTRVEIDPDRWFPDVDRTNNVWERPGAGSRERARRQDGAAG